MRQWQTVSSESAARDEADATDRSCADADADDAAAARVAARDMT